MSTHANPDPGSHSQAPHEMLSFAHGDERPRSKFLMSVHFAPFHEVRFHHSKRERFFIPPAKKGSYHVLEVFDGMQIVPDTSDPQLQYGAMVSAKFVHVDTIIADLMREWTENKIGVTGKVKPGLIQIADSIPTKDEFAKAISMEEIFCRAHIEEGDRIYRGDKSARGLSITELHRGCLDWMESERRDWFKPIEKGRMKTSPATGNRINMEALTDNGIDLLELYVKYDMDPLDYQDIHCSNLLKNPQLKKKIQARLGVHSTPSPKEG